MNLVDRKVRHVIYETFVDEHRSPTLAECAAAVDLSATAIRQSWQRLAGAHEIVVVPGEDHIWMAHPFSGIPTDHEVSIGPARWFANCAWDALSVLALLGDGAYRCPDPLTGAGIEWTTSGGTLAPGGFVHFLVPARQFWDDIGFT